MTAGRTLFPAESVEHVAFASEHAQEEDIARLLEHWSSLRQGASMPRKDALDPAKFGPILTTVTIQERLAHDNYRIRLFATMLTERLGRDATGENYLDLVPEAARESMKMVNADCLNGPCVYLLQQKTSGGGGLVLNLEFAVLPLADTDGQPRFILTGLRSLGGSTTRLRGLENFGGELSQVETIGVKRLSLD